MPLFKYEAVVAKCRALYGKLLKPADYESLFKCSEVSEIAAYLHDNTAYSEFLKDSNLVNINRNKLEYYIKKSLLRDYIKIYKFTSGDQRHFISLLMTRFELEYILKVWREYVSRKIANNPAAEENDDYLINESLLDIWTIYQNNPKINLAALKNIKDVDQFKDAIKNSSYAHVFNKYTDENMTKSYTELESALYDEYYDNLYKGAEVFEPEIRRKIEDSISIQADLINLCRISRMMFNFKASRDEILPLLVPLRKKLKEENIKELLKCPDKESFFLYCQNLYYGSKQSFYEYESMTEYMNDFLDKYYKTIMNLTSMGFDIIVRYFRIKEIEIRNLFYLIEGIRYRMSLDEIKKHVRT